MVTQGGDLTRAFKALGDPTRRGLVELLLDGPLPVHSLAEPFRMSRPAVSRHLRLLKEAGLVTERQRGRERLYSLVSGAVEEIGSWAAESRRRLASAPAARRRRASESQRSASPKRSASKERAASRKKAASKRGAVAAGEEERRAEQRTPTVGGRRRPPASDDWQSW
jgi:DNA-binding transcriptional ArsR family regulator